MLRLFEDASMKQKQLELHGPRRLFFPSPMQSPNMDHQKDPLEDSSSPTRYSGTDTREEPIIKSCEKFRLIMFPTRSKANTKGNALWPSRVIPPICSPFPRGVAESSTLNKFFKVVRC